MAKNYAVQYSKELANAYGYVLNFGQLWNTENSERYKVINAKTIQIPNLTVGGRVSGNRDTIGSFSRNWNNGWETKELTNERSWETLVHPNDIDQTNTVASIKNITKVMNEEDKFPEMDAFLISTVYKLKNTLEPIETKAATAVTQSNVLTYFDELMDKMDEANVPAHGRILYVDTFTKTLIDNAREVYRQSGNSKVTRNVTKIDEVTIVSVPSILMKTSYNFDVGYTVAEDAKQVKMFLVHPSAVLPVASYSFAQLDEPSATSKGKYVYYEESHEDVFLLNKKHNGVQMLVCEVATA
ncbi:MAG: capsid protein [Oscillospiraceae bacterium]|nr:capsid protein [Oscillospiraceae bacterium]